MNMKRKNAYTVNIKNNFGVTGRELVTSFKVYAWNIRVASKLALKWFHNNCECHLQSFQIQLYLHQRGYGWVGTVVPTATRTFAVCGLWSSKPNSKVRMLNPYAVNC